MHTRTQTTIAAIATFSFFAVLLTGALSTCGCSIGHNMSGANQEHAAREAKRYVDQLAKSGVDAKLVACVATDSDGDGYLACNVIIDGQPQTLDCAGAPVVAKLMIEDKGCKAYMPKIRVNQTVTTGSGGSSGARAK